MRLREIRKMKGNVVGEMLPPDNCGWGNSTGLLSCGIVLHAASSVYPSSREGRVGSRLGGPVQIDIVTFVQCSGPNSDGP
jgi:hypothetical protein